MTIEEAFGLILQQSRKKRRLSQEQLGFESGYHRTYISQLERGRKSPSLRTIFQLADALKMSPSEMVSQAELAVRGTIDPASQVRADSDEDN